VTAARWARILWLALCAAFAWLFAALAWHAAGWGPVWPVALFAAGGVMSVCAFPAGAAVGILARRGAHPGRPASANLAARHEYVIPSPPEHSPDWVTRPWPLPGWREVRPGPASQDETRLIP
jgi:hypothetical protein